MPLLEMTTPASLQKVKHPYNRRMAIMVFRQDDRWIDCW